MKKIIMVGLLTFGLVALASAELIADSAGLLTEDDLPYILFKQRLGIYTF